jgi:hypothetical protein
MGWMTEPASPTQSGSGTHPASYSIGSGVKRPGPESKHLRQSSAEFKNEWG